jgi:peptidoglycan/xylan/chitin deacetylase (PgdA/CDA1 family)
MSTGKRIIILMYHMISASTVTTTKIYDVTAEKFRGQMEHLKNSGYTPVTPSDLCGFFDGVACGLPEKPVLITFDDGYLDVYKNAAPVLAEFGFPAAAFIVSGFVGKTNCWIVDKKYSGQQLMGWQEINEIMKSGFTIGSHTATHPRLSHLVSEEAERELTGSKKMLEDRLGRRVDHFAYPYGDFNESVVSIVKKAGYRTACSTRSGFNSINTNSFELRRLEISGHDTLSNFSIKLTFGTNNGSVFTPLKYYLNRLSEKLQPSR